MREEASKNIIFPGQCLIDMKKMVLKIIIIVILLILFILAWAPWITDEYAVNKVMEKMGGPDARFYYMDMNVSVKDVPKEIDLFPFGRYITLPGEGWFVTFYGEAVEVVEGDIWI